MMNSFKGLAFRFIVALLAFPERKSRALGVGRKRANVPPSPDSRPMLSKYPRRVAVIFDLPDGLETACHFQSPFDSAHSSKQASDFQFWHAFPVTGSGLLSWIAFSSLHAWANDRRAFTSAQRSSRDIPVTCSFSRELTVCTEK